MEQKRRLSSEETAGVSGGTGEAHGTDAGRNETAQENQGTVEINMFGLQKNHPVYCKNCSRLLGYSSSYGTESFVCSTCNVTSY